MRVITGKYKGRRFSLPASFKARPTTDFAKENLFNVLRAEVDFEQTTALDLFAGTGSITLELLSRGCPRVVAVELEGSHCAFITSVLRQLGESNAVVAHTDALRFITRCRERFGLVFADPPYALPVLPELPDRVMSSGILADDGLFVLEHGKTHKFDDHPCFVEHRAYGSVNFSFFRKQATTETPQP